MSASHIPHYKTFYLVPHPPRPSTSSITLPCLPHSLSSVSHLHIPCPSTLISDAQIVTVIFALILACVASTVALFMFFKYRSQWIDSWWRRGLCDIFLATAVCGMHFLGLGGTSYYVRKGIDPVVLYSAGDQATRLTIGKSSLNSYADDSHICHVRCYCALCRRFPHLRC